jgi:hypothetical protein
MSGQMDRSVPASLFLLSALEAGKVSGKSSAQSYGPNNRTLRLPRGGATLEALCVY